MKTLQYLCVGFGLVFGFCSCEKIKSYPATPQIAYESYRLVDTLDTLQNHVKKLSVKFSFVDGDGDLFKPLGDTAKKDSSNSMLYFYFYKKVNGKFEKVPESWYNGVPPRFSFNWNDVMSRDGQNKTQKGTMEFYYQFLYPMHFDTITVSFYIVDMAYNKSNVDSVPTDIILVP